MIDDFVAMYRDSESVPEPYWLLELGDMPFANGATTTDLEYQPMESCKLVLAHTGEREVIFDRCPLDFLAYLSHYPRLIRRGTDPRFCRVNGWRR
ncbi:hypothetical protein [Ancylobacter polymorphus]|uniref:Uncharacterized protein n=1 Tax=Ancylobacter polymorphus TaxID=223390 RepID=A0A9E7D7H2_9HYPH|nr:hypothetical protein [Ancylobacter polymorphus]UOK73520.1 hypothetical protein K9D25_22975 [Ancylobacter polymorphus]